MADVDVSDLEAKFGIPPGLYGAIVNQGERSAPGAVSPKGAIGRAQLMPATAAALDVDPYDPEQNLEGGAKLTAQLWQKYQDPALVAAAYNAGEPAVDHHGGVPPYAETQQYVQRVTAATDDGPPTPTPAQIVSNFKNAPQGTASVAPSDGTQLPSPADIISNFKNASPSDTAPPPPGQGQGGATDPALPSPTDIQNGFQSAKAGSGSVRFADTGQPVNAAQEATAQKLYQAGQFDPSAKPGQAGYVVAEAPGVTAPPGVAKIGVDGTFTPAPPTAPTATSTARDEALSLGAGAIRGTEQIGDQLNPFAPATRAVAGFAAMSGHPLSNSLLDFLPGYGQQATADLGLDHQPKTTPGKYAYAIGENVPNAFLPAEGAAMRVASVIAPGLASEFAGQTAEANGASPTGAQVARGVGGIFGGGIAGAGPQIAKVATGAAKNLLLKAAEPYMARFSQGAAEAQAGAKVAAAASDLPAVRASLANGSAEIVQGSTPTTFQQTADTGLGALERGVSTNNPKAFADARGAQNAARVEALGSIQAGADPLDVAKHLKAHYDDLDATTDAAVQAATSQGQANVAAVDAATGKQVADLTGQAQGAASAIGGIGTPEGYGADLRNAALEAQAAAKAREGALWTAVDPQGDLTGNVRDTKAAAADILASVSPSAKPLDGEAAAVFKTAQNYPDIVPVRDLIALRGRVSEAMATELGPNGSPSVHRLLTQLRGAIQDNLGSTISDKITADDAAVADGTMPAADNVAARVNAWIDDFKQRQRADTGSGSSDSFAGYSPGGSSGRLGADGTGLSETWGSGSAPGNSSLPSDPGQPTFDAGAADRLAAATAATKARAQVYRQQPVASLIAKNGGADQFRLTNGAVPSKVFHPGPKGFDDVSAYLKAAGDGAAPTIREYAASTLRRDALTADGTIDPARFNRWQARHIDALRALPPEARAQFSDAVSAGQAVGDAAVARTQALREAQADAANAAMQAAAKRTAALKAASSGPAGKIMTRTEPQDVTRAVATVLGSSTSVADMRSLATALKGSPEAFAGLRQAVADHITGNFLSNTDAGASGVAQIKADGFQTFVKQNRAALSQVFNQQELGTLDAIAADIKRSKLSETALKNPGGPGTAQDTVAAGQAAGGKKDRSLLDIIGAGVGAALGSHFGHGMGGHSAGAVLGSTFGGAAADVVQRLRTAGISRVDDLVTRAMVDPRVAKALLDRVPSSTGAASSSAWQPKIAALITALSGYTAAKSHTFPAAHANKLLAGGVTLKINHPTNALLTN
jgi:hypothetical protein